MPRVLKIKLLQEYSYDYKEGDERILNIKDFVIIFSLVLVNGKRNRVLQVHNSENPNKNEELPVKQRR